MHLAPNRSWVPTNPRCTAPLTPPIRTGPCLRVTPTLVRSTGSGTASPFPLYDARRQLPFVGHGFLI